MKIFNENMYCDIGTGDLYDVNLCNKYSCTLISAIPGLTISWDSEESRQTACCYRSFMRGKREKKRDQKLKTERAYEWRSTEKNREHGKKVKVKWTTASESCSPKFLRKSQGRTWTLTKAAHGVSGLRGECPGWTLETGYMDRDAPLSRCLGAQTLQDLWT